MADSDRASQASVAVAASDDSLFMSQSAAQDVGIVAMELYVPQTYVSQERLEEHDGVSKGKYTIGLGQRNMAFVADNEDVYSMCLTATARLLERAGVDPSDVGRLDVGTETLIDKSKSCKSVLMQLFGGNTDVEGVDSVNACYGGTAALFNTVSWMSSPWWDGRHGVVVAGDVAVYGDVRARPTGGAAAVAMLIGPDAPLVFERGMRASHMENTYDFYKPQPNSEYPTVDGKLSNTCFLRALDACYTGYVAKASRRLGRAFSLDDADHFVFHTPYNKLVQKAAARLAYLDLLQRPDKAAEAPEHIRALLAMPRDETYADAAFDKAFREYGAALYRDKVLPSTVIPRDVGNSYTASLYVALMSLCTTLGGDAAVGKRIVLFSYGSGLAASMFSLRITRPLGELLRHPRLMEHLAQRTEVSPAAYEQVTARRAAVYGKAAFKPQADNSALAPGAFYLCSVDEQHRRTYARVPLLDANGAPRELGTPIPDPQPHDTCTSQ